MKLKSILMTAALGLALGSMAEATTTVVRFTGSTAFRANTHYAIVHAFDSVPVGAANGTIAGAGDSIFSGNIGGSPVIIKCHWSGSEAGIQAVAAPSNKVAFLPDSTVAVAASTSSNGSTIHQLTTGEKTTYATVNESADVAMSDTWQASSAYYGTSKGYTTLTGANGYTDGIVGVVAFKWLASPNATITDITTKQAANLYTHGYVHQSAFTGLAADEQSYIYALGRDNLSGTRLTTVTEIGFGAAQGLLQYEPQTAANAQITGTGVAIDHLTLLGTTAGYTSGGNLVKAIANNGPSGVTMIGYAGQTDADGASQGIAAGAKELSYNGIKLGFIGATLVSGSANTNQDANVALITEGKYTFWGYEHCYYASLTGVAKTAADRVAQQLRDGSASSQAAAKDAPRPYLVEMNVTRDTDGAPVYDNGTLTDGSPY